MLLLRAEAVRGEACFDVALQGVSHARWIVLCAYVRHIISAFNTVSPWGALSPCGPSATTVTMSNAAAPVAHENCGGGGGGGGGSGGGGEGGG